MIHHRLNTLTFYKNSYHNHPRLFWHKFFKNARITAHIISTLNAKPSLYKWDHTRQVALSSHQQRATTKYLFSMTTTENKFMHNQYQIENRNQSKMHMPKFFAYYNSVASAQSSIASIMNYPSSWNITQLMKMLTINSLRQGSISKTGHKDQYKLSKIISSPDFAEHILTFHSPLLKKVFQERPDHCAHHIYTECKTITVQVGSY